MRVELLFKKLPDDVPIEELKRRVLGTIKKGRTFWESGGNVNQLRHLVEKADTTRELIVNLGVVLNTEYSGREPLTFN